MTLTEQDIEHYARTGQYPNSIRISGAAFRRAIADFALRGMEDREDAERYRWLRARWDANTDEDIEAHTEAMNADDPDAAIDNARQGDAERRGK